MVVKCGGKNSRSLRVVVRADEQKDGVTTRVDVELKPSMLVKRLLTYILCQYVLETNKAPEVLVCTIPGM